MASNVNNQVGDVSLKMGVDTSSVAAEAKAGAEKANAAAESTFTKQVNERDAALRARQAQVISGLKAEANAAAAAAEQRKQAILNEAMAAADAMKTVSASASNAAGSTGVFANALNTAKGAIAGIRAALGPVMFALGALGGAYALINSRIEENKRRIQENIDAYSSYAKSVQALRDELSAKSDDQVTEDINNLRKRFDVQLEQLNKLKISNAEYQLLAGENYRALAEAQDKVYKDAEERGRAARARLAQERRMRALEEQKADQESRERRIAEDEAKAKAMEADFDKLIDMMKQYEEQASQSAKRINEAFAESFRSIREESNRAFNTDQAATMVQLAGNLRTTATIAGANMNRIIVGGED
jgi:hypothetical protein